jgi:uncharacterized membrane protein required for colicin V production
MDFLPSWLNPFDVIILLALLAGTAWGFIRGLVRMALTLLVLYVAIVLAMSFYRLFGWFIGNIFGMPQELNEALAFVLILVAVVVVANFVISRTYKDTELPGVRQIDQLGGLLLGFLVVSLWIGLAILVVAFLLSMEVEGAGSLRLNILGYFQSSFLIPIFYRFLPVAFAAFRPWVPMGQLPEIFTFRLY